MKTILTETSCLRQNDIAYDQSKIEVNLDEHNEQGMNHAYAIYSQGAFAKPMAAVWVPAGLNMQIAQNEDATGTAVDGSTVKLFAMQKYHRGDQHIVLQYYPTSETSTSQCEVGGNPNPVITGCLEPEGFLYFGSINKVIYRYDVAQNNVNFIKIQGFSTNANFRMRPGDYSTAFFPSFAKFDDYYGQPDYGDRMITAIMNRTSTALANGNMDFSNYGYEGRAEAFKLVSKYVIIAMYVARQMEVALQHCYDPCKGCSDDHIHALEAGVAFYTGSLEGTDGSGKGNLLYALADDMCHDFRTCNSTDMLHGGSQLNAQIFEQFSLMQVSLIDLDCVNAKKHKDRIIQLMYVPLIQATLRRAYHGVNGEKDEAEGAVLAASVLPVLFHCNTLDAKTVYANLKTGRTGELDFQAVKSAFEKNYECMRIKCEDIGGIWNGRSRYEDGAEPCSDYTLPPGLFKRLQGPVKAAILVGGVVALLLAYLYHRGRQAMKREDPNYYDSDDDDDSDSSFDGRYA